MAAVYTAANINAVLTNLSSLGAMFVKEYDILRELSEGAGLVAANTIRTYNSNNTPLQVIDAWKVVTDIVGNNIKLRAQTWLIDLHDVLSNASLTDRQRDYLAETYTTGLTKYHITSPWYLNNDVYRNMSRYYIVPVAQAFMQLDDDQELFAALKPLCFKLLLFTNRETRTTMQDLVTIKPVRAVPVGLFDRLSTVRECMLFIKSVFELIFNRPVKTAFDTKRNMYARIYTVMVKGFVQQPLHPKYAAQLQAITSDSFERTAALVELLESLIATILLPSLTSIEADYDTVIPQLLVFLGDHLSTDTREKFENLLRTGTLEAAVSQSVAVQEILSDVRKTLHEREEELISLRDELAQARDQLEATNKSVAYAKRLKTQLEIIGANLSNTFASSRLRALKGEFIQAWNSMSGSWRHVFHGAFVVHALILRTKLDKDDDDTIVGLLKQARELMDSDIPDDVLVERLDEALGRALVNLNSTDQAALDRIRNVWRQMKSSARDRNTAALYKGVAQSVAWQSNIRSTGLRDAVTKYLNDHGASDFARSFARNWTSAFTDSGADTERLVSYVEELLDALVKSEIELTNVRGNYEKAREELKALDESVNQAELIVQTLSARQDAMIKEQHQLETQVSTAEGDAAAVSAQRQRVNAAAATALASTSNIEQYESEASRLASEQVSAERKAASARERLASVNAQLALIAHEVNAAQQASRQAEQRREESRRRMEKLATAIDRSLAKVRVPVVGDGEPATEPASLEWFESTKKTIDEILGNADKLQKDKSVLQATVVKLNEQISAAGAEQTALNASEKSLVLRLETLTHTHEALVTGLQSLYNAYSDHGAPEVAEGEMVNAIQKLLDNGVVNAKTASQLRDEASRHGETVAKLQSEQRRLREQTKTLQDALESSEAQVRQLEESVRLDYRTTADYSQLERALADVHATLVAREQEADAARNEIARLTQEKANLERDLQESRDAMQRVRDDDDALSQATAENSRLLNEARAQIAALTRTIEQSTQESDRRVAELKQQIANHEDVQRELELARTELGEAQEQIESTRRDYEQRERAAAAKLTDVDAQIRSAASHETDAQSALDALRQQVADGERDLATMRQEVEEAEQRRTVTQHELEESRGIVVQLRDTIERLQATIDELQAANVSPTVDRNNIIELLDTVQDETKVRRLEDNLRAAQSTIAEYVARAATSLQHTNDDIVETTVRLNDKQMKAAARPRFVEPVVTKKLVFERPVDIVENTFTESSQPVITSLIEVDDAHEHFNAAMKVVREDMGVPAHVLDQFYAFTIMVQGRVDAARSFWLRKEEPGLKALVSHAIEASTKNTQTVFPVRETKQLAAIRDIVRYVYQRLYSDALPARSAVVQVREFFPAVAKQFREQWPSATFSFEEGSQGVVFSGDRDAFIDQLTEATLDLLRVQHPQTSVTRVSHLAISKYISDLFKKKSSAELAQRSDILRQTNEPGGVQLFALLSSMLDPTYFAALQLALQHAKIPLDFNDLRFVRAIHDGKMADYVALLYIQAPARSRHVITAKRTSMINLQVSVALQELQKYDPPRVDAALEEAIAAPATRVKRERATTAERRVQQRTPQVDYTSSLAGVPDAFLTSEEIDVAW